MSKAMNNFFRRLRRRHRGEWKLRRGTGAIRAMDSWHNSQCPLTAAANMRHVTQYEEAGRELGLTYEEVNTILDAADSDLPLTEEAIHMRMRLLRACGLAP